MASDFAVEVHDIIKRYRKGWFGGHVDALRGVTFNVPRGKVFGLLGPNGAGKTTLIKILLGIIRRSQGNAKVLGHRAGDLRGRKMIGYLPEHLRMARHQTARTALSYYGRLSGLSQKQISRKASELLELVGLQGRDKESVQRFSKGMQQRLGLAQALLHDPELLVLDEPTDGLDPVGRAQIRTILTQLSDAGKTVFLNSHLLQEVELVCDRVAILDHGQLRFVGSIAELTPDDDTLLRFEVQSSLPALQAALQGMTTSAVQPIGRDAYAFEMSTSDQAIADQLVDRIRAGGISILQLNRRKKTLENAFLELIQRKREGSGQTPEHAAPQVEVLSSQSPKHEDPQ